MNSCIFCSEGKSFLKAKDFLGDKWPYPNRVVFFDSNVYAVVGYSPQVVPYILIIPYRHINSMLEMNKKEKDSFIKCLEFLSGRGGYSQQISIFEHGGKAENSSSSIDHCHIHVIDGQWKMFEKVKWKNFEYIDNFEKMKWNYTDSYLLIGEYNSGKLCIKITKDTINEHQYFRKRLAEIIGDKRWNWKDDINYEKMIETMRLFNV